MLPSQGRGSGIDARHIHFFIHIFITMYEEYSEQGIDGLNEKIMKIVEELKGDHSEVEILDGIIHQSKLLFTTYKVRYAFIGYFLTIVIYSKITWSIVLNLLSMKLLEK